MFVISKQVLTLKSQGTFRNKLLKTEGFFFSVRPRIYTNNRNLGVGVHARLLVGGVIDHYKVQANKMTMAKARSKTDVHYHTSSLITVVLQESSVRRHLCL